MRDTFLDGSADDRSRPWPHPVQPLPNLAWLSELPPRFGAGDLRSAVQAILFALVSVGLVVAATIAGSIPGAVVGLMVFVVGVLNAREIGRHARR
jgi:hypothetical protein